MSQDRLFLGVDVGTGSARAALFTSDGQRLNTKKHEKNIQKWTNSGFPDGSYEQSTEDIWRAVCSAVEVYHRYTHASFRGPHAANDLTFGSDTNQCGVSSYHLPTQLRAVTFSAGFPKIKYC